MTGAIRPDAHTLIGAYVLDATDELEGAAVRRHLTECPSCAAEAAELQEAAAALGSAVPATPPRGLRDRVLAEITRVPQLPPAPARGVAPMVERRQVRAAGRWRTWSAATAAAAVLAVAGAGTAYLVQEQRVRDLDQRVTTSESQAAQLREISDITRAPDARKVVGQVAGGGQITAYVSASLDKAVIYLDQLSPLGRGRTYQLWMLSGDAKISTLILSAGQTAGTAVVRGVGGAAGFAVTIEPDGGSRQPTTNPVGVALLG